MRVGLVSFVSRGKKKLLGGTQATKTLIYGKVPQSKRKPEFGRL